jgi:hypothetical protein
MAGILAGPVSTEKKNEFKKRGARTPVQAFAAHYPENRLSWFCSFGQF